MNNRPSPYLKAGLVCALLSTFLGGALFDVPPFGLQGEGFCGTEMSERYIPSCTPPLPRPLHERKDVFLFAEQMPLFPGCDDQESYAEKKACADKKLLEFVYENIKYPPEAIAAGVGRMVVISFVVERDGSVGEPKIVRDPGAGIGAEALRVVNLINEKGLKFDPPSSSGRTVRVQYNLPVRFRLE